MRHTESPQRGTAPGLRRKIRKAETYKTKQTMYCPDSVQNTPPSFPPLTREHHRLKQAIIYSNGKKHFQLYAVEGGENFLIRIPCISIQINRLASCDFHSFQS